MGGRRGRPCVGAGGSCGAGAGGGGGEMAAIGVAPATDGGGPFERGRVGGWPHHRCCYLPKSYHKKFMITCQICAMLPLRHDEQHLEIAFSEACCDLSIYLSCTTSSEIFEIGSSSHFFFRQIR